MKNIRESSLETRNSQKIRSFSGVEPIIENTLGGQNESKLVKNKLIS